MKDGQLWRGEAWGRNNEACYGSPPPPTPPPRGTLRCPPTTFTIHQPPLPSTNHHYHPPTTITIHQPPLPSTNHHYHPPTTITIHQPPLPSTNHHYHPPTTITIHQPPLPSTNHHYHPPTTITIHQPPLPSTNHHYLITSSFTPSTTNHHYLITSSFTPSTNHHYLITSSFTPSTNNHHYLITSSFTPSTTNHHYLITSSFTPSTNNHHYLFTSSFTPSTNHHYLITSCVFYPTGEGVAHRAIFDKSVQVKQLSVVEAHGILLLRVDKVYFPAFHILHPPPTYSTPHRHTQPPTVILLLSHTPPPTVILLLSHTPPPPTYSTSSHILFLLPHSPPPSTYSSSSLHILLFLLPHSPPPYTYSSSSLHILLFLPPHTPLPPSTYSSSSLHIPHPPRRDGKIHVFRLSDFECEDDHMRTKSELKEHRLERTKGCHMYAISRPGGSHLRMVVGVGKKVLVLQWRHSAAWTAWCPASDTDTVEGFQFIREIALAETPTIITLVDSPIVSSAGGLTDNKICIGYKHQWDLLNERTGEVTKLHHVDASKVNLVTAIDIYEDDEAELLLCYNNTCHFQKLTEECSNEFDFHWNSVPEAIVCAFPYILAFTQDSIEIRLIINGNLVQTMDMPRLAFITSKSDIFFATTAPESFTLKRERVKVDRLERDPSLSPPPSPHGKEYTVLDRDAVKPFRIYRIPFRCLTGSSTCERRCPTPSTPLHPPVLGDGEDCIGGDAGSREGGSSSRGGMHLRVSDQRYASRSCTASPTHNPSPPGPFPTYTPSPSSSPPVNHPPPQGSPSHQAAYQKPRNRTNSLTVDSAGSLLNHHHHPGRPHLIHSHSQHHQPQHHHHHHHHHHHSPVK
ncbi:hypothetical protein Pcinc_004619 [Petrolisthes cinctipes]|uniref:CNH domain-containing protein n=1 Tax=Petrolisthes cinctipes TaxID=88211 RepID=A0AAE1L044_PETCI|nr:hypothetical protein Pcinc_004619 [Petrolisthes cinctipes]